MAAEGLALERSEIDDDADYVDANQRARTDWWAELRGIVWLVLAVLGFHSLIAKPFYIPSESMMPGLLVGDRLIVTKYPYGYSWVTPTFHLLPFLNGRLFGRMPARGDVVIVTPPGTETDYIKRVIALPGDRIAVRGGIVYLNGVAIPRTFSGEREIQMDANTNCDAGSDDGGIVRRADGTLFCKVPIYRETLPEGLSYDTIDMGVGKSRGDNYPETRVPRDRVFLMGDNRDNSADSRYPLRGPDGKPEGLGGAVPWENIGGRAEFITFSLDGSATWNPLTWAASFRSGRAGTSLHPQRDDK